MEKHKEYMTDMYYYLVRSVQFGIVAGMFLLYRYMLSSRKKFMKSIKINKQNA